MWLSKLWYIPIAILATVVCLVLWLVLDAFYTKSCEIGESDLCLRPKFPNLESDRFQFRLYISAEGRIEENSAKTVEINDFDLGKPADFMFQLDLSENWKNQPFLGVYWFVLPQNFSGWVADAVWKINGSVPIISNHLPLPEEFGALIKEQETEKMSDSSDMKSIPHIILTRLPLVGVPTTENFSENISTDLKDLLTILETNKYLPLIRTNNLDIRLKNFIPLTSGLKQINFTLNYKPINLGWFRFFWKIENFLGQLNRFGISKAGLDQIKSIFEFQNVFFLALIFFVGVVHLLFDFLAFKNDISFWKNRKTMEGLSTSERLWRVTSMTIISLFLIEDQANLLLVATPHVCGTFIEYWKVKKALKIKISFSSGGIVPKIWINSSQTVAEKKTEEFDTKAVKFLAKLLIPICVSGAVYSLLYLPHRSWYSWLIQSLANGVFAFGFLFMLPQLFVNYKLKSVAHLPWRTFMYKMFNTFIDDVFAFAIRMPLTHRIACFRDDFVFFVYLYQRYLYPVDFSRINEFGESFEDQKKETDKNSDKIKKS